MLSQKKKHRPNQDDGYCGARGCGNGNGNRNGYGGDRGQGNGNNNGNVNGNGNGRGGGYSNGGNVAQAANGWNNAGWGNGWENSGVKPQNFRRDPKLSRKRGDLVTCPVFDD